MRIILLLALIFILTGYSYNTRNEPITITAIDASFPLRLDKIDLQNKKHLVHLSDDKVEKIKAVVRDYYYTECSGDSAETNFAIKDVYINTIQLHDSLYTLYLVLLKHFPTGQLNSKVIFYNNVSKEFTGKEIDFNIHALYDHIDGKIKPSNLRKQFKIEIPEIELTDHNKDGINEFKFSRLYHNGTANAIETVILKPGKEHIAAVRFGRQWLK